MTAPEVMTVHPTDETLAAFIDDRLTAKQRLEAVEHLAECGECRTFVNEISDLKAMNEAENIEAMDEADNVVEMPKRGGWRVALASFAVAAGLLVVFGIPILRERQTGPSMTKVLAAGRELKFRPSPGRLSVDLPYKRAKTILRGPRDEESLPVPPDVYGVLGQFEAVERPDPYAHGIAYMTALEARNAIPLLREAVKTNRDAIPDLAAALIASGTTDELREAVKLSEGSRTPVALWNRAMALNNLNDDRALQAWKDYLAVDSKSPWADEARERIRNLQY